MKKILEYWREIGCLFAVTLFSYFLLLWSNHPPKTNNQKFLLSAGAVASFLVLLVLLRQLWRKKWKYAFAQATQQLWAKAGKLFAQAFERFAKKWNLGGAGRQTTLYGKTTVRFDFGTAEKETKRAAKQPKWKNLQTDRERLGFLYRRMITEKIKTGTRVYASDTPSEARERSVNSATEDALFDCYTHVRYDERVELSAQAILSIKSSLDR